MIVVDSSAIIAVLEWEEEGDEFLSLLTSSPDVAISTVTVLECNAVVFWRHGENGLDKLRRLFDEMNLRIRTFDETSLALAIDAFKRYGKGIHKARLNFGDCASYALAQQLDAPLLFKGGDFAATDVKRY